MKLSKLSIETTPASFPLSASFMAVSVKALGMSSTFKFILFIFAKSHQIIFQYTQLDFADKLSNQVFQLIICYIQLLERAILWINVQEYHNLICLGDQVNQTESIFTRKSLLLVWQAQFDNNQIGFQQNHIVVLTNLLNWLACKLTLDFILHIGIDLAPNF